MSSDLRPWHGVLAVLCPLVALAAGSAADAPLARAAPSPDPRVDPGPDPPVDPALDPALDREPNRDPDREPGLARGGDGERERREDRARAPEREGDAGGRRGAGGQARAGRGGERAPGLDFGPVAIPRRGRHPIRALAMCRLVARGGAAGCPARADDGVRERRELARALMVRGREVSHRVAFTFDDGPHLTTTPAILDALERYDVPAAFFVVGWRIAGDKPATRARRRMVREIRDRGYLVGNHTFRHSRLSAVAPEEARREIDRNAEALRQVLGYAPRLFRPPYGAMTDDVRDHLAREGLTEVRWSIDTEDFHRGVDPRRLRARTVESVIERDGGVVLMHDTKHATAEALAGILDDLERESCRRLAAGERPIVPVSLHYFLRDPGGEPRPVPVDVEARTARYVERLPARCRARATARP